MNRTVAAAMTRTADGEVIQTAAEPPPITQAERTLVAGMRAEAARLAAHFAPTPAKVRVDSDMLATASGRIDGGWIYTDSFAADEETLFVILSMPDVAAGNIFSITITPRNRPEEILARRDVTWEPGMTMGIKFSPAEIAEQTERTRLEANLYVGPKIVLSHRFILR